MNDRLRAALAERYRIERELGAGGMATVYLAHDLKHDRKVAIKVLRPELAAVLGAERFLQEIKTTANLQHPNILPLFDSGEVAGFLFYVMPFIDGETLRTKLNRETQLGIDEAIGITTEVADALDYAHRQNVIHRDIKPENILLHDGRPMVADFGIALAISAAAGNRMTETGLSLGTPHYMSPEQATAEKEITSRSDIYSLGAVLYEMLTGEPPHTGGSAQQIILRIVTDDVRPVTEARKTVPPNVAAATEKALQRLPADRFAQSRDFAHALGDAGFRHATASITEQAVESRMPLWRIAAIAGWIVALVLGAAFLGGRETAPTAAPRSLHLVLPDSAPLALSVPGVPIARRGLAISNDGGTVAYVAQADTTTRLYVRQLSDTAFTALPGTEGAYLPFLSPDGEWVGYFLLRRLMKIRVSGGQPTALGTVQWPVGASWASDGRILVADFEGNVPTWFPEAGGTPQPLGAVAKPPWISGALTGLRLLPGEDWAVASFHLSHELVLYSLATGQVFAVTRAGLVPRDSAAMSERIVGYDPVYTSTGHLLYLGAGDGVLMALPFDAETREVRGDPFAVVEGVRQEETYGFGQFAIAYDGTLVYAPGRNTGRGLLAFVDANGAVDTLPFRSGGYEALALSPDGNRIAVRMRTPLGSSELVVLDLRRGQQQRTRFDGFVGDWFQDGERVLATDVATWQYVIASLETGATRPVDGLVDSLWAGLTHDNQGFGMGRLTDGSSGPGITLHLFGDTTVQGEIAAGGAWLRFSPDGRWLAYLRFPDQYVVVSPLPPTGRLYQVSHEPAGQPNWSRDASKLFYRTGSRLFVLDVSGGASPFGVPRVFAEGSFARVYGRSFDVAPDGRALVVLGPPERAVGHFNVVTNFFSLLNGTGG